METDLLAAARGLLGKSEGIAIILGTGANACVYSNGMIQKTIAANGIWLGDEGSGGYLGKKLIQMYLDDALEDRLKIAFENEFSDRREEILEHVYRRERPNKYLADYAPFLHKHRNTSQIKQMLEEAFCLFFEKRILKLKAQENHKLACTGSIAYYFQEELRKAAKVFDLEISEITQSPLNGLADFHQGA